MPNFLEDFQCLYSDPAGQIAKDMSVFSNGVTREDIDNAIVELNKNESSLIHFTIKVTRYPVSFCGYRENL